MNPGKHPRFVASAVDLGIETAGDYIEFESLDFGIVVEDCCCFETPAGYQRGSTPHRNLQNCWVVGDCSMECLQQVETSAHSPVRSVG
jgi:hypothetical protein